MAVVMSAGVFSACGADSWSGSKNTLVNGGAVVDTVQQGFITETEDYVYFINGVATATNKNNFGTPIKGSLVVASKSDLSKSEVIVPKLFASSDYKSGFIIDGGYVYYATPSTHKNSEGEVANTELSFMRTKLDASGKTEEFFTAPTLSTEYRILINDNTVYIVYYDTVKNALVSYNTSLKEELIIAKTDKKAKSETLSAGAFKFVENANNGAVVLYTTIVYAEDYVEDKANSADYQRAEKPFNNVYLYSFGDGETASGSKLYGKNVLNGNVSAVNHKKYVLDKVIGGYLFYKETDSSSTTATEKTLAVACSSISNVPNATRSASQEILRKDLIADTTYIENLESVYFIEEGIIKNVSLLTPAAFDKAVAYSEKAKTMLFVSDGFAYYTTSDSILARISIQGEGEQRVEQIISEGSIATSWYKPEIIDGKIFFCDNSTTGSAYVKQVNVSSTALIEKEEDEDGNETTYVKGAEFVGVITDADKASIFQAKLSGYSSELNKNGELKWEIIDGQFKIELIDKIVSDYNALTSKQKKLVEDSYLKQYENMLKASELSEKMYAFYGFDDMTTSQKDALKTNYEEIITLINSIDEDVYETSVLKYVENNIKYYFYTVVGDYYS